MMDTKGDITLAAVSKLYMMWMLNNQNRSKDTDIEDIASQSFICNVLNKRMEAFDIPVVIPDHLSMILDFCTDSNPGLSLMMLYDIIKNAHIQYSGDTYVLQPEDFVAVFTTRFPVLSAYPDILQKYSDMFDNQKIKNTDIFGPDNLIDTREYWLNTIKFVKE